MSQKTLVGLAIAALVALVAAVLINHSSRPQDESRTEAAGWLLPALHDHVNDVDKVTFSGAGDAVLATLERGKDGWTLAEKGGYAVDTGKLRAFLLKLADAREVERKTANAGKYDLLGVEDVSAPSARGVQVELAGLSEPVKLIIGNAAPQGDGTYVRRAGDAQSWLVSGSLAPERAPADWLRKDLADIPAERIASVTLTHGEAKPIQVAKEHEGDANFSLADVPKGREAGSEYALNSLASTLSSLRFDDVLPAAEAVPPEHPVTARYATFDGIEVEATAWQHEGKDYARFAASLDEARADAHIAAQQAKDREAHEAASQHAGQAAEADSAAGTPAEGSGTVDADAPPAPLSVGDPARDREQRLEKLRQEVADLNAHFSGWTFVIPAYKYANMDKKLDDLLAPAG
jgi:hypothetical protein